MKAVDQLKLIRAQRLEVITGLLEKNDRNPSWLAKKLGITRAGGHRYMKGAAIPEEKLAKIADLFDIPLLDLLLPGESASTDIDWTVAKETIAKVDESGAKSKKEKDKRLFSENNVLFHCTLAIASL